MKNIAIIVLLVASTLSAQDAAKLNPIFLTKGESLVEANFDDGRFDNEVIKAKQDSIWEVKDGVLIGKPSPPEIEESKKGHDGSSPLFAIDLIDQNVVIEFDFRFDGGKMGNSSIQIGHTISQLSFTEEDIVLVSNDTGDREPMKLESGKWYSVCAEVFDNELVFTLSGVRTFYIENDYLKNFKQAFKVRGPKGGMVSVDNLRIHTATGIQPDWGKRKSSILKHRHPIELPPRKKLHGINESKVEAWEKRKKSKKGKSEGGEK